MRRLLVTRAAAAAALAALLAACSSTTTPAHPTPPLTPIPDPTATPTTTTAPGDQPTAGLIPVAGAPPVAGTPWFLTIGDSVTFGFSVDPARAGRNQGWPAQLQPLLAAGGRRWSLYDTACSGERTDTYYSRCPGAWQVPFLATTSQHDAALGAIKAHAADLRAIFVDLGSNDLLYAVRHGIDVTTGTANLRTALTRIVTELRSAAPRVPVILCNFYDPLANLQPATLPQLITVNAMVAGVARSTGARLADFFAAINTTTTTPDAHLCDFIDCAHGDVHPTVAGQARLARAALASLDR